MSSFKILIINFLIQGITANSNIVGLVNLSRDKHANITIWIIGLILGYNVIWLLLVILSKRWSWSDSLNGTWRLAIAYIVHPNAHISAEVSYSSLLIISGAKKSGVPVLVSIKFICLLNALDTEKSPSLQKFRSVKNILCGLISLCIIFFECNKNKANIIWDAKSNITIVGIYSWLL